MISLQPEKLDEAIREARERHKTETDTCLWTKE